MPRFSKPIQACLKRTMLPRVPSSCFFSESDIQHITSETGLNPDTVTHWAENLRWRFKDSAPGAIEAYLKSTEEVT